MKTVLLAPAKLNLCLLVGPVDNSGYHQLFTVFVPVGIHDRLEFDLAARPAAEVKGELQVRCHAVEGEANLVARALRSLEQSTGWCFNGRVTIDKRIPMSAGMGGGSTDAAAALRAGVAALAENGGPVPDEGLLRRLARGLGADVPFFLDPRPALARGIGDLLEPVALPSAAFVLLFSSHQLSTAEVYRTLDRMREAAAAGASGQDARVLSAVVSSAVDFAARATTMETAWKMVRTADEMVRLLENDLETVSFRLLPELCAGKRALLHAGARGAVMTGSGPTLLGLCRDEEEAAGVARRLKESGPASANQVAVVSTL